MKVHRETPAGGQPVQMQIPERHSKGPRVLVRAVCNSIYLVSIVLGVENKRKETRGLKCMWRCRAPAGFERFCCRQWAGRPEKTQGQGPKGLGPGIGLYDRMLLDLI
jgi:hypothetical protein